MVRVVGVIRRGSEVLDGHQCQMQKRMMPILAKRKKGDVIGIVGEVVGLSSANASIYLKECLAVPRKEELDGSE